MEIDDSVMESARSSPHPEADASMEFPFAHTTMQSDVQSPDASDSIVSHTDADALSAAMELDGVDDFNMDVPINESVECE